MTLLPVFARDILKVGATGQGLLLSAMGVGALCSSVLLASFGDRLPRINLMLGRGDVIWDHYRSLRGISLVRTFTSVDGDRRHCPCDLPRPRANGDSNLLTFRLPRPDNGCFSYDPCGAVGRGDTHRGILHARWSAVGCGLDEHRRRAGHGWHILGYAARPAHPIGRHVRPSRLASVDCSSVCAIRNTVRILSCMDTGFALHRRSMISGDWGEEWRRGWYQLSVRAVSHSSFWQTPCPRQSL